MTDATPDSVEEISADLPSDPLPDPDGEVEGDRHSDDEGLEGLRNLT